MIGEGAGASAGVEVGSHHWKTRFSVLIGGKCAHPRALRDHGSMATTDPDHDPVLRIYLESLMNATCPKGHQNDIPSGQGRGLREAGEGYEADFTCPDCGAAFPHWVRVQTSPADADPDTLLH